VEISSDENFQNNMLAQLYDAYENKMYGIAYSILNNVEQAEDAVQDAIIKLIPHLSTIQRVESLKTKRLVVYTIKNIAIDLYRRNRKETQLFTKEVEEKVTSENQKEVPSVKSIEDRHMITQLLSKLPEKYREIIQYRCFYELSYREISSLLNISEDVAAKRYERARKMVKEMIGDEVYE
jgi:RNA polymerase sigma-70 factor (ECF subfamily)